MEAWQGMPLEVHQGVALLACHNADPIRGVVVGVAVDLVVVEAKSEVSRSLLKNLMLNWRSTMPSQCRPTRSLSEVDISTSNLKGISPFIPAVCATKF
jgi:hypothetical protein